MDVSAESAANKTLRKSGPACDACRIRKTKCDYKWDMASITPARSCTSCRRTSLTCTFTRQRKRRGPLAGYVAQLPAVATANYGEARLAGSQVAAPPDTSEDSRSPMQPGSPARGWPMHGDGPQLSGVAPVSPSVHQAYFENSPLSHGSHTLLSDNLLEQIVPRPVVERILDAFYDYVYPIFPLPHRVSFLQDLILHREEQEGEEEWAVMVISLVAFTLAQLPHDILDMTKKEGWALASRCTDHVLSYLSRVFADVVTLNRLIAMYCVGTVVNNRGKHVMARSLHGASVVLVLQRGLHNPTTYESMGHLEQEMHRRMFWLVYNSDRSAACTEHGNLLFDEAQCAQVDLPLAIDDDWISEEGFHEQPESHAAILSGFRYTCQQWRIAGQFWDFHRRCNNRDPTPTELAGRIYELTELLTTVEKLMSDCPPSLRLEMQTAGNLSEFTFPATGPKAGTSLFSTEQAATSHLLRQLLAEGRVGQGTFQVQQANIYVTEQLLRFMIIQHREGYIHRRREEVYRETLRHRSGNHVVHEINHDTRLAKGLILLDLLQVLHSLPIEVHAINSFPGVTKIRFVASALLEDSPTAAIIEPHMSRDGGLTDHAETKRVLFEYLRILSVIEALYSPDAESIAG